MSSIESRLYEEFLLVFKIPPMIKKGETYFNSYMRFQQVVAKEDIYPTLSGETILALEDIILSHEELVEISLQRLDNQYSYLVSQNTKDLREYKDYYTSPQPTRVDALLAYLISYSHMYAKDIAKYFEGLRNGK